MNGASIVPAQAMAVAVARDRQFRPPQRPRFIRELTVLWQRDGLIVDGTGECQVLRGAAVGSLLPRLLPLLDGEHTVADLAQALTDVPRRDLDAAIALLYTRGLLEEGDSRPAQPAHDRETVGFFRRHLDITRVNPSAGAALARLGHSHVYVQLSASLDQSLFAHVARHLLAAGVGAVSPLGLTGDVQAALRRSRDSRRQFVVALVDADNESDASVAELAQACLSSGVPWLRGGLSAGRHTAVIGPYFEAGVTTCYQCYLAQHQAAANTRVPNVARASMARLWADLLVLETVYLLSRIGPLASGAGFTSIDTVTWRSQNLRLVRTPGCPCCRPVQSVPADAPIEPAVRYEDAVAFPPRHLVDPKAHQTHYHVAHVALARDCKTYPGASIRRLAPPAELPMPSCDLTMLWEAAYPPAAGPLELDHVATLLLLTGGVRHRTSAGKWQRWTATGGNLGSVELYLLARDVRGLECGCYYYDSGQHGLARLPGADTQAEVAARLRAWMGDNGRLPPALLVCGAALRRVYRKYGPFAYRIVHLDAGLATAQLRAVATGLHVASATVPTWPESTVMSDLGLDVDAECVTALVTLGGA
ncbi:MAG: SagB family peptide dehydrogenase [Vicinamibacterales bacterium]